MGVDPIVLVILISYITLLFILAHISREKIEKVERFFRTTGLTAGITTVLAIGATYHTAFAIPGSYGFAYKHGVTWAAFSLWTIPVAVIFMYLIGPRIAALGLKYGYVTPSEILGDFYESKAVRVIYAIYYLIAIIPYFVANISGPAILLSYGLGYIISYEFAVIIITIITLLTVIRLGFRAAFLTNVLQGAWMWIAMYIAAVWIVGYVGGLDKLYSTIATQYPKLLTLPGPAGYGTWQIWLTWPLFGICIGWAIAPRTIAFWLSSRSPEDVRKLAFRAPLYLWSIYVPVILIAFATLILYPRAPDPDMALPVVMAKYAPPLLWGLIITGSMAAGISTLITDFLTSSAIAVRDIYVLFTKETRDSRLIAIGRLVLLLLVIPAVIFSIYKPDIIVMIVTMSLSMLALTFPAIFFAVFPTGRFIATKAGVLSGLIIGYIVLTVTYFPTYVGLPRTFANPLGFHAGFWGFISSFLTTIVVSLFTKKPSQETIKKFHEFLHIEMSKS